MLLSLKKSSFIQGAIGAQKIADSIAKHQSKVSIGAHQIFLGQVREDVKNEKKVVAIEYTAYTEMAEQVISEIREEAFAKFDLVCLHIYHSIDAVQVGEICLFVFVSSKHRAAATEACRFIVEEIKSKVPIFGKEIFEDSSHQWKVNS